jgi:predicted secreted protein with PEFG-CTERM motif
MFLMFFLFISMIPAFGESHPEYFGIENPSEYVLEIDEHVFSIYYNVNAKVIAMAVDPELTSLLIGLENTSDSIFEIDLKHELISAYNNEFAILVNGLEVDYDIVSDSNSSTLTFFVPELTEEIEIIGTHVIPEFPFGVLMGFVILFSTIILMSRTKTTIFRL